MAVISTNQDKLVSHQVLTKFMREVFGRIKCAPEVSEPVVQGVVDTALRGVDTHAIRLLPRYIKEGQSGRVNLSPQMRITQTLPTTALLDADHTYGMHAASFGMDHAIRMAEQYGMGSVAIYNSSHFGAAGIYALAAANRGFMGFSFTHGHPIVAPSGGSKALIGTNPIAFAVPMEGEDPFCLDMATSGVPWNKVLQYRAENAPLKPGWAVDREGKPTTDPHLACALLPIGDYKGYGLAMMVDILSALLTGMAFGPGVSGLYSPGEHQNIGHFVMAINISAFTPPAEFASRMKEMAEGLRSSPRANNDVPILVANDPQKATRAERLREGIPIPPPVVDDLKNLAMELGIDSNDYPSLLGT